MPRDCIAKARLAGLSLTDLTQSHCLPTRLLSLSVVWTGMFGSPILGIPAFSALVFSRRLHSGIRCFDARAHLRGDPLLMLRQGLAIMQTVLLINLASDHLHDSLARDRVAT